MITPVSVSGGAISHDEPGAVLQVSTVHELVEPVFVPHVLVVPLLVGGSGSIFAEPV
jgi:hypothetical protein